MNSNHSQRCHDDKFLIGISQSSVSLHGFGCPQQRLRNSTPSAQGIALYVREGFPSFWQNKLEYESCVFHKFCSRINNFYVHAFNHNPGHGGSLYYCRLDPGHGGSLYYCRLDPMARVQSVDDKAVFVFVGDANAHHSKWFESVSPTDRHGRNALDFCNLSGCEQLVCVPIHIAGNIDSIL